MKSLVIGLLALVSLSAGQGKQTFTGAVSEETCAGTGHKAMRMDPSDEACTKMCVMLHGSRYALEVGSMGYVLSNQDAAEKFAGQKVRVVGTLDAKTRVITVESITASK